MNANQALFLEIFIPACIFLFWAIWFILSRIEKYQWNKGICRDCQTPWEFRFSYGLTLDEEWECQCGKHSLSLSNYRPKERLNAQS